MSGLINKSGAIAPRAFQKFNTEGPKRVITLSINEGLIKMLEEYSLVNELNMSASARCLLLLGGVAAGMIDKEDLQWHE